MKILLTGGTGFLGSALARFWVGAGHEVHVPVRPTSSLRRLASIASQLRLTRIDGESSLFEAVHSAKPDAIVHTACAYGRAGETPAAIFAANVAFGVALLEAARLLESPTATSFLNTGTVLDADISLYALTKRQFSAWGSKVAQAWPARLRFIDIGLQHMYGPDDDDSKFTTHVLRACLRNDASLALTAGEQRRDFIHVDDVVSAYDMVLRRASDFATSDEIDIGSGDAVPVREFVETVHRLTSSTTATNFGALPYRPREAMLCVADTTRLRALGWRSEHDLVSGLQSTISKERQT